MIRMKNPSHPGLLIKANCEELGLAVADVAHAMLVDSHILKDITTGKSPITPDIALRLDKVFWSHQCWFVLTNAE